MPPATRLLLRACVFVSAFAAAPASPLHNTFARLSRGEPLKVVVVGNSVTAGAPAGQATVPSFYVAMENWLRRTFPQADIRVSPRIIYAIGPEVQLFYQDYRVLSESPDLVLAEFGAANGAWGRAGAVVTEPATEGYVRRLRELSPKTDVVLMMGVFKTMMDDYRAGNTPPSADFIHRVAAHYDALAVDAGAELARRVVAGEPWETYMKDFIHPSPAGYTLYGDRLVAALEAEWKRHQSSAVASAQVVSHATPPATLHPSPWKSPRLVPASAASASESFFQQTQAAISWIEATTPGATGGYQAPEGRRVIGVLMRESKPCGNLEVRVPGGEWTRLTQSRTPHFTVKDDPANRLYRNFFATYGLPEGGVSSLEFRVSASPETTGAHVVQIVGFFELAAVP